MGEGKLKAWEAAGLIDSETAARIRAWEADHARPVALWAVFGIAALAIGLGILSVVAANWDDIPGVVRLTVHFALMIGIAGYLWLKGDALARQPWLHEGILFVFGALGMTFLGHVGQVYQTSSPLWQPLALWLALFAPLLLLRGSSWLTAAMVVVTLVFTGWNYALDVSEGPSGRDSVDMADAIRMALAVSAAVLLAGLGAWMRARSAREAFWIRLEQLAATYGVGLASLVIIASAFEKWTVGDDAGETFVSLATGALIGAIAALLVWRGRGDRAGEAEAGVLLGAALSALPAFVLSDSQTAAAVLFMALWAGIAFAALHAGWRGIFQIAVGAIAVRLIVFSFEWAGDLLLSGVGLIISGLLILGVAFGAIRVSKEFAPDRGPDHGDAA